MIASTTNFKPNFDNIGSTNLIKFKGGEKMKKLTLEKFCKNFVKFAEKEYDELDKKLKKQKYDNDYLQGRFRQVQLFLRWYDNEIEKYVGKK